MLSVENHECSGYTLERDALVLSNMAELCLWLSRHDDGAGERASFGVDVHSDLIGARLGESSLESFGRILVAPIDDAVGKQVVDGNGRQVDVVAVLLYLELGVPGRTATPTVIGGGRRRCFLTHGAWYCWLETGYDARSSQTASRCEWA